MQKNCAGVLLIVRSKRVWAVFITARKEGDGVFFSSAKLPAQLEVFGSALDQTPKLRKYGYAGAAGVIAGAALEAFSAHLPAQPPRAKQCPGKDHQKHAGRIPDEDKGRGHLYAM